MSNISSFRLAISSAPFVGVFASLYNSNEVQSQLDSINSVLDRGIQQMTESLIKGDKKTDGEFTSELGFIGNSTRTETLASHKRGRVYAKCGIIGDVLAVATLTGLAALSILSLPAFAIISSSFLYHAWAMHSDLSRHNQGIEWIQTTISLQKSSSISS